MKIRCFLAKIEAKQNHAGNDFAVGRILESPETFTLGIPLKFGKIKTEKIEIIVRVVIFKTC